MIKEQVLKNEAAILKTYEELHNIPEWGYEEFKTSQYIRSQLEANGVKVTAIEGTTGLIAEIDSGFPGNCIGLRADIDALPFTDGHGETYYYHACGHDSHATMAMWTLLMLKELALVKKGKVRVIFQPAEERLTGARTIIAAGAGQGLDELYGVHIRPVQEIRFGEAAPALWHGGSVMAEVTISGRTAHGARPHLGANAINAAALSVLAINSIWLNPADTWSVKVTRLKSGGSIVNVIPDKAVLSLDMRAATNVLMDEMTDKVKAAVSGAAAAVGCSAEFKVQVKVPAADYDDECITVLQKAISEILGAENSLAPIVTPGSDDFHEYKQAYPQLKTAFLALGADAAPGLHDPKMSFNRAAIPLGTAILTTALSQRLC